MKTDTFTLTTTPREIRALSICKAITVGEDDSVGPTIDLQVRKPSTIDNPRQLRAGEPYTFRRADGGWYLPGNLAGCVNTAAGSSTFYQDEE